MKYLFRNFLHALWTDEQAARRWLWGLAGLFAAMATTVLAFGVDVVLAWDRATLIKHLLVAGVAQVAAMVSPTSAAKAPPPPQ